MPRKKTPANATQTVQDDLQSMFGTIGEPGQDPAGDSGAASADPVDARLKALADQFAAFQADAAKREERLQNLAMQLLSAQRPAAAEAPRQPAQAAVPEFDLSGLPDPVQDPDGFKKQLGARVSQFTASAAQSAAQSVKTQVLTQADREKRLNDLWSNFRERYDDLAEHDDFVELTAGKLIKQAVARGVDAESYIFADPEGFMEQVAKNTRERIAKLRGTDEEEGDEDPGRTAGIAGGSSPFGAPGRQQQQPASNLISELKEAQRKLGVF